MSIRSPGWRILAPLALFANLAWHLWREHALAGAAGFALDDTWIHAAIARNLAAGDGFAVNPGEWVGASTAPLWTLLLTPIVGLFGADVVAIRVLGIALTLVALDWTWRAVALAAPGRPAVAAIAATVLALLPSTAFGALSGLEVPLAIALVAALLLAETACGADPGRRGLLPSLLVGLAVLARPEALALAPWVWCSAGLRPRTIAARVVATAVPIAPIALVYSLSHGSPLPTTFFAKIHRSRNPAGGQGLLFMLERGDAAGALRVVCRTSFAQLAMFLDGVLRASPLLVPALGAAFVARGAGRLVGLGAWCVFALPLAIGLMTPRPDFGAGDRYAAIATPALAALAALGVGALATVRPRGIVALALLLVAVPLGGAIDRGARYHAMAVRNTRDMHETLARWVASSIPAGSTVAVHDIGALAYFGRVRLLDLEGIASPELLPRKRNAALVFATLFERRPDFLIVAPNWYPDLARRADIFEPIHVVEIPPADNRVLAGPTMVVFRATWPAEPQ